MFAVCNVANLFLTIAAVDVEGF